MKYFVYVATLIIFTASCAESEFASGDNNAFIGKVKECAKTDPKCTPSGLPGGSSPGGPSPGGSSTGTAGPDLTTDNGGNAVISRSISGFAFSGDGPGSCGLDATCRPAQKACPTGYGVTKSNYLLGDCYKEPGKTTGTCYANRALCVQTGAQATTVTTQFHFYPGATCPEGFEPSGPPGTRHHLFGIVDQQKNYSEVVACKKSISKGGTIPKGTKIVTDIVLVGVGNRYISPQACPAKYISAGVISDCVHHVSVTPPGTPGGSCSGFTQICKKFEVVP